LDQIREQSQAAPHDDIKALDIPELYQCVHCGLCLNQCPTYRALRLEADSPRGRIHLVKATTDGRIDLSRRFQEHLYLCLLCRACETACPSGVQYGHIAEAAREWLGPPGSGFSRAVLKLALTRLISHPARVRAMATALKWYQRCGIQRLVRPLLPTTLQEMDMMMPFIPDRFFRPHGDLFPAIGTVRAKVAFLNGCVMPVLFGTVNEATVRVLQRNGCKVVLPKGQTCCGALNIHNGEVTAARKMARQNIDAFLDAGVDTVIVNAAGCGATLKEYGHLLRDDPEYAERAEYFGSLVKDAAEFLAGIGLIGDMGRLEMAVTYQDPCHLAHGQRVRNQPRSLLQAIPGLTLVEMEGSDRCCGSAGIYNITHPEMSQHLLREKMQAITATGAEAVVAPNPGCMLQLRFGAQRYGPTLRVWHLMDLLEHAYSRAESLST